MAGYIELYMDQGADFITQLVVNDDVTSANVDITGYSFASKMKYSYYATNTTANLVCNIVNASLGVINVTLDYANTTNIDPGRYYFDIISTDTSNTRSKLVEGVIFVNPSSSI